jgi:hypothetical protein
MTGPFDLGDDKPSGASAQTRAPWRDVDGRSDIAP